MSDDKTTARVEVVVEMETSNAKVYLNDKIFSEVKAASLGGTWQSASEALVCGLAGVIRVIEDSARKHGVEIRTPKFPQIEKV